MLVTQQWSVITKPVLCTEDSSKGFKIFADAANKNSISGGLIQRENSDDKSGYVVCFCSRKLTDAERHYPTIEVELLAILYTPQKLRYWVYGRKVIVWTDHHTLAYLKVSQSMVRVLSQHSSRLKIQPTVARVQYRNSIYTWSEPTGRPSHSFVMCL